MAKYDGSEITVEDVIREARGQMDDDYIICAIGDDGYPRIDRELWSGSSAPDGETVSEHSARPFGCAVIDQRNERYDIGFGWQTWDEMSAQIESL